MRTAFVLAGLFIIIAFSNCFAQGKQGDVLISNGVFVQDSTINEVCAFWQQYLHSRPDSLYDNPFWNPAEKKLFPTGDLLTQTYLGNVYELMRGYKPTILSITPQGDYFKIRTLFAQQADSGFCDPVAITSVFAKRDHGKFYLYNSLLIVTRDWQHHQIGNILFVCPPYHVFTIQRAEALSRFNDSIATLLHEKPTSATYYFANTKEELYHAQGLDYYIGEGNAQVPGGFSDHKNRILYGAGSGEWYPHEFVHLYANPKFKSADPYMLEGLAVFFGGSRGNSLDWLIRHADSLFAMNKALNIDSSFASTGWDSYGTLDYVTGADYLFGGLLCKMIYEKGGMSLVLRAMTYGPEPENGRYKLLKELFGVDKDKAGAFLRRKLSEYAEKASSTVK